MSRDLALAQRLATPDRERCKVRTGRAAAAATRSRIGLVSRRPAGSERHEFDVLGAPGDGGDLVLLELAVERLAEHLALRTPVVWIRVTGRGRVLSFVWLAEHLEIGRAHV